MHITQTHAHITHTHMHTSPTCTCTHHPHAHAHRTHAHITHSCTHAHTLTLHTHVYPHSHAHHTHAHITHTTCTPYTCTHHPHTHAHITHTTCTPYTCTHHPQTHAHHPNTAYTRVPTLTCMHTCTLTSMHNQNNTWVCDREKLEAINAFVHISVPVCSICIAYLITMHSYNQRLMFHPPSPPTPPHTYAHPNWLQDYTVDIERFKQLPAVCDSSCPPEFMELAFACNNVSGVVWDSCCIDQC